VTRASVKTARRAARRVAGPLIGSLLAVMMAGCSSSGTAPGDAGPAAALAPQQTPSKPVTFAPVIGAPARVSTKLNELLVAAAGQKAVPVVPPKDAEYTIRGYLVAASDPKGTKLSYIWDVSDKANKRKRMQGEELIEGKKGGDPWAAVDDAAMQRVAAKAIDDIAAWLPKGTPGPAGGPEAPAVAAAPSAPAPSHSASSEKAPAASGPVQVASLNDDAPAPLSLSQSQTASTTRAASSSSGPVLAAQTSQPAREPAHSGEPVRPAEPVHAAEPVRAAEPVHAAEPPRPAKVASLEAVAVVPLVSGAPGDGSQSLSSAMRKHLQSAGVKLVEQESGPNVFTVKGEVEMGGAVNGQQPITIHWTVVDPSGKQLDKAVVQRNKVQAGSLDGPWGQIADLAAGEAAKSIARLITKPTG
jgi:hypothetical protein